MNLRKMLLIMAVLLGTSAMMFLPGCANPVAATDQGGIALLGPQDLGNLKVDNKDVYNGFFYQQWDNAVSGGSITYANVNTDNEKTSKYTLTWNSSSSASGYNFVCGTGWGTWNGKSSKELASSNKVISYTGTFNPAKSGSDYKNCYLDFYGWANNYDIEYYVLESYGEFDPSKDTSYSKIGEYDSDGNHYVAYFTRKSQQPSPKGSGKYDFDQIYSIRTPKLKPGQVDGAITLQKHVDKWKEFKHPIYSQQFQVMATEGYGASISGNSEITIFNGSTSTGIGGTPTTPNTPSGYPEQKVALKARYGGGVNYLTVQSDGLLNSTSTSRGSAQTFYMVDLGGGKVALRSNSTGKYVCAENAGSSQAVATRPWIDRWETFTFGTFTGIANSVMLKNNAWTSDGAQAGWYLRFDGNSQQNPGTGCIFYLENF
jgi:endo-1,4-beta-xylanase